MGFCSPCGVRRPGPAACSPGGVRVACGSGAWRFENWIVDASEKGRVFLPVFFIAVFFDRTSFLVLFVDRFVIISDVMICRLGIC